MYRYRVVSKREVGRPKIKTYATLAAAEKRITLLTSPEPWIALGHQPDDLVRCHGGPECNCDGMTYREQTAKLRAEMPTLEWVRLERREVGPWEAAPAKEG